MHFTFESIIVGIYVAALSLVLHIFVQNWLMFLFTLGFSKHFLGYIFQLHTYYCNHGDACIKVNSSSDQSRQIQNYFQIIGESIIEGIVFVLLGLLYIKYRGKQPNIIVFAFCIGVFMHIISEIIGLHNYFCTTQCRENNEQKIDL